ncbi:hypothetical protein ACRYCC_26040 [Actinomadura scrupuli]|uniref:hypothetical protein n=1 Tax=Actinomadura scrupuli TaxID=559629 RepID=UPI003D9588EB
MSDDLKAPASGEDLLIDPDCRDGKCGSCIGGLCEHDCHQPPVGRPSTPPRENPSGGMTITVQRTCNGCGTSLGDATPAELDAAVAGRWLPDASDECPSCSPATWKDALATKQTVAAICERAKTDHEGLLRFLAEVLGKRDSMRLSAAMVKRRGAPEYAKAYEMAAEHIEDALFSAFELWPGGDGDQQDTTSEDMP